MTKVIRVICILVGCLFIFSGFVKAIDPLGFSYKLEEYYDVFADDTKGLPLLPSFFIWLKGWALYQSMFFCVLEMVLGVCLVFAIRMPLTSWLLLLLMAFFTWLTGYSDYTGKVTECGCFGDAIKLTAHQSFIKDVVLLALTILIFFFRKKLKPAFKPLWSNVIALLAIGSFGYLTIYCYNHLPIIDFRPYKVGNDIRAQMTLPPGSHPDEYATVFTYRDKKTGETGKYLYVQHDEDQQEWFKKQGLQKWPWQDTVWMANHDLIESKSEIVVAGEHPKITDFRVWDNDNNDLTAQALDDAGYHFWLVAYDMTKTNHASFEKINVLAKACDENKINFWGLTATSYDQLDPIRHDLNAAFPFYYADGTVLKTIIRSNPGIVLLKGSTVLAMWHYHDVPTFDEVKEKYMK